PPSALPPPRLFSQPPNPPTPTNLSIKPPAPSASVKTAPFPILPPTKPLPPSPKNQPPRSLTSSSPSPSSLQLPPSAFISTKPPSSSLPLSYPPLGRSQPPAPPAQTNASSTDNKTLLPTAAVGPSPSRPLPPSFKQVPPPPRPSPATPSTATKPTPQLTSQNGSSILVNATTSSTAATNISRITRQGLISSTADSHQG
ncbi:hypothetical protein VaNZ11_006589, partial [Volvox africanus]